MNNSELAKARELIQKGKYSEARIILEEIDSPIATKWLRKLDEVQTTKPDVRAKTSGARNNYLLIILMTFLGILLGGIVGFALGITFSNRNPINNIVLVTPSMTSVSDIATSQPYEFIGNWIYLTGAEAIFKPDGTGQMAGNQLEWEVLSHTNQVYEVKFTFTRPGDTMYGISTNETITIISDKEIQIQIGDQEPASYQLVTKKTS